MRTAPCSIFLRKPVDVDLDRVVADLLAPFAEPLDELVLADEPARSLQQHFEQDSARAPTARPSGR
jgi:hypothetical protein